MKRILAISTGVVAGGLLLASAALAVGSNGSFEDGADIPGGFIGLPAASTAIDGWTVSAGSVDYIRSHWPASDGSRSIDLNGGVPGAISQDIATVVGATYAVEFDLSGNPDNGPALKVATVSATGAASQQFTYNIADQGTSRVDMKWEPQLYTFMATNSTTTLTFAGDPLAAAWGPALDNVQITETLADAAMCKKGGWESMIDSENNTFKNQGDCVSFFATNGKNLGAGN